MYHHYHEPEFEPNRDEMLEILKQRISCLNKIEAVPLSDSCGRIAAERLCAPYSLPNRPVSAFDGIAVRFSDFADGCADTSGWKEGNQYVFSNTGVAIPDGYDTVIAIEDVTPLAENTICGGIRINPEAIPKKKGEYVEPVGSQLCEGETILEAGERINPEAAGILASAGFQSIPVYEKPRVLFLPTGDELVPSGAEVPAGKNIESNSFTVLAQLRRFGARAAAFPIIPDDSAKLRAALLSASQQADLIVIGAGSSRGSHDYTMDILRELGEVAVQELGTAPGKHCSLSFIGSVPVIGIPGPPGGALLISRYYLRAAVSLLASGSACEPLRLPAELCAALPARPIDFMQPIRLTFDGEKLLAAPLGLSDTTRAAARTAYAAILYCPRGTAFSSGERVIVELPDADFQIVPD